MTTAVSTIEANKALVRRAIGYNHGDAADPEELFAPDFVAHMPGQPPMDRTTFEQFVAGFEVGFPGYTYEIQGSDRAGRHRRQPGHLARHPPR